MFGMGFTEIMLIAIVAIIALGPEKLPSAMVDIAKFFKKFKSGVEDAKSALDQELELEKLKQEADKYKSQLTEVKSTLNANNLEHIIDSTTESSSEKTNLQTKQKEQITPNKKEDSPKKEKVSFKDKKAKINKDV